MKLKLKLIVLSITIGTTLTFSNNNDVKHESVSFTENKGQVHDQNHNLRSDILYSGTDGQLVFHLKKDGISYQISKVNTWKEDPLSNKEVKEKKLFQIKLQFLD